MEGGNAVAVVCGDVELFQPDAASRPAPGARRGFAAGKNQSVRGRRLDTGNRTVPRRIPAAVPGGALTGGNCRALRAVPQTQRGAGADASGRDAPWLCRNTVDGGSPRVVLQ